MNRLVSFVQSLRYFLILASFAGSMVSCHDDDEAPIPEVTAVNPTSALPGTLVSITGKAFSAIFSENKVSFNGKEALVSNASSTQLNVVVPAGAETGPVMVTVNGKVAINQPVFTVEPLPSVISGINPVSGGYNTIVTITGLNFNSTPGNNIVTFNGTAGVVESATATTLTVKVPIRAGSGAVIVNGVTATSQFTYKPDVYIIGYAADNTGYSRATYWKNGVPTTLSSTGQHTYSYDMAFVGEDVYVSGYRYLGVYIAARQWKNGAELPLTDDTHSSYAEGITAAGNDVYIAGYESIGGKTRAVYWKNGTLVNVTDGSTNATASGIAVNGQDVYISGNSTHTNGNTVATYWKNGTSSQLTSGVSFAWDIFLSGNDVYSTGSIRNTGPGVGFVSYWKNATSVLFGPGLGGGAGRDIVVVGSDVYVAGGEDNAKGIRVAKYWKNGVPVLLSEGTYFAMANAIDVIGEDVYVAGVEYTASGQTVVKLWKNGVPVSITDGGYYASAEGLVLR